MQKKGDNPEQAARFQYCYVAGNRFGLTQRCPKTAKNLQSISESPQAMSCPLAIGRQIDRQLASLLNGRKHGATQGVADRSWRRQRSQFNLHAPRHRGQATAYALLRSRRKGARDSLR